MYSYRIKTAEERVDKCKDLFEKANINMAEVMHKFISESNSFAACLLNCENSINLFSKFTRVIIKGVNIVNELWKSKRNTVE